MNKQTNYWNILTYIIYVIVIIFALLAISSKFSIAGVKLLVVKSGSMEPTIKTGSMVIVKSLNDYQVGDIVTFKNLDNLLETTTHHIINKETIDNILTFTTQGDANNAADAVKLTADRIVGKVIFKIPYLGYIISFARTWPGVVVLIIVPATIIVYDELQKIKNEISRRKRGQSDKNY